MRQFLAKIAQTWKLFAALAVVVLRDRELRRKLMFVVSMLAMGLAFLGMVAFEEFLIERVALFLAYWGLCGFLVFLMLLLAIYDMARVRTELTGDAIRRLGEVFRDLEKSRGEAESSPSGKDKEPGD